MLGLVRWLVVFRGVRRFLTRRATRYVLAWLLAAWLTGLVWEQAWKNWAGAPYSNRNDKFGGHTSIDFGSSWMMGRMLVLGEGHYLYDRHHLRNMLRAAYPREDEDPAKRDEPGDAENLMGWIMGEEDRDVGQTYASCLTPLAAPDGPSAALLAAAGRSRAWTDKKMAEASRHSVAGPLYPPLNAFLWAWMGLFRPATAFLLHQVFDVALAVLIGLGVSVLSSRRVWAPVAVAALVLYPGFFGNLHLGQTGGVTLAFLVWGWALMARGRPVLGGAVWGLLAFKPVWAVSFFLVLLPARRWRSAAAMLASGAGLALATLPFVGLHSWFDWLDIGAEASYWYKIDSNWIHLSRDVLSIPRRYFLDFDLKITERIRPETLSLGGREVEVEYAAAAGWALLLTFAALTVALPVWRRKDPTPATGPRAGFLLVGGWLCCFHFMYYDVLASYLGVAVLLANPRLYLRPRLWLRQALAWQRRALPWRRPPRGGRAAPGAVAVLDFPPAPPCGPREVAVLSLPRRSPFGWIGNPFPVLALAALLALENPLQGLGLNHNLDQPYETYALMVVWAWCGLVWLRRRRPAATVAPTPPPAAAEPAPDVLVAHADGVAVTPAPAR